MPELRVRHRTPDGRHLYVGPRLMQDALLTAADRHETIQVGQWWVSESSSKVWTNPNYLRQFVNRVRYEHGDSFSRLEVVDQDGIVTPVDEMCPPGGRRRRRAMS